MTRTDTKTVKMTEKALAYFREKSYSLSLYQCAKCGTFIDGNRDVGWMTGQFDSRVYCSCQCAKNGSIRDETRIGHDESGHCGATRD
jgi:hypothetical protein